MSLKIAIVDIIGLKYNNHTVDRTGLGGSESAVIYMARELTHLGFDVTVFNNFEPNESEPSPVKYVDYRNVDNTYSPDIFISVRSLIPFLNSHPNVEQSVSSAFGLMRNKAKHRVLWMHDTFIPPADDPLLEKMVVAGMIDEIFTLSDFHTTYVSTCHHGGDRRNPEVLKRHIWMTRNGIKRHIDEVDVDDKEPFSFVYNASATKGLQPLLDDVWPRVKALLPNASLTVIGGYYRYHDAMGANDQEKYIHEKMHDDRLKSLDVRFTGVIPQREIAGILARSSMTIYPASFPETSGISTLESLAYNTPVVTCRFGALEETAIESACYLLDYAIEPNPLYPGIDKAQQVEKFVVVFVNAVKNTYLLRQKRMACNVLREIEGWDTVALQWKQHFYRIFGLYLDVREYRKVQHINHRVAKIFNRRFTNIEDNYTPVATPERKINVITPLYNAETYISTCIDSVVSQNYHNWELYLVDDCSTDKSSQIIRDYVKSLHLSVSKKIHFIQNTENVGALKNQYDAIWRAYDNASDIFMLLDGDDSLVNNPELFNEYNRIYSTGKVRMTYGSMWSMVDRIPLVAQPYPYHVHRDKTFRKHIFPWNAPYTHLRTFTAELWAKTFGHSSNEETNEKPLKDDEGNFFRAGGDIAMFYALIENTNGPEEVHVVQDIVYKYNDTSPINDYKVNGDEQTRNANTILRRPPSI